MEKNELAKNILVDRTCDTCKHIEYETGIIEVCHLPSGGGIPSYCTFPIPKERTCLNWEKYKK